MSEETHQGVFGWVLRQVAQAGLLRGKTIGIDSTTLEANAAMKSIVRRAWRKPEGWSRPMQLRGDAWIDGAPRKGRTPSG
jgi:hypothetical protein